MLEPVARDSAMAPSFHERSGAARCELMRLAAVDPIAAAAGERTSSVLPARGPAAVRINFISVDVPTKAEGRARAAAPQNSEFLI